MNYREKLLKTKLGYPFEQWREAFDEGLEIYTQENCDKAATIFDNLIMGLIELGQNALENDKVALFKTAIISLNVLDKSLNEEFIESMERDDLAMLVDDITDAAGLDPDDYGDGEGLASEWREW